MITPIAEKYKQIFEGSDQGFYLANPNEITIKKNGGQRWGVKPSTYDKEYKNINLEEAIQGQLDGKIKRGVVLPPIRRSNNKCLWGAIDIDGNIYKDQKFKKEILDKVKKYNLPLTPCFSKSKGLHLYIKFSTWTEAPKVVQILKNFLHKLNLPEDTEIFPKQTSLDSDGLGNGIMLPYMKGVGNDWIKSCDDNNFETGTIEEFFKAIEKNTVAAESIKIELPEKEEVKKEDEDPINTDCGYTKYEILYKIKDGSIEQHPTMGGRYHSWIQVVIAKAVKQEFGNNEILKLIKEVHEDGRGIGYIFPESYEKQISHCRKKFKISNPGDTNFLKDGTIKSILQYEKIKNQYCYVMANDMFNKIGTGEFYQSMQINNFHAHEIYIKKGTITGKLQSDKNFKKAETFMTNAKFAPGLVYIDKPGIIPLVQKGTVLNIHIPNYITSIKGDVEFIIQFFIWLIGEKKWRIIEQWIAFNVQQPGTKMKWAIVLVSSVEGVGKGLLARIVSRILGYENVNENANYKHLTNTHNTLLVGTQVIVLNEVSLGDFKSKSEGTNALKNFVADDFYSCNFKNKPMIKLPNFTNFMLFSNDERVLGVNNGARRYYFCNIKKTEDEIIQKTDEGFFDKAWKYVDSDEGAAALLHYFKDEVKIADNTIFMKRAPQTDDLLELIEQSKHPLQKKLEWDLRRPDTFNRRIFKDYWPGIIIFDWLNEQLNMKDKSNVGQSMDWGSFGDDAIYKFLAANCIRWNNGEQTRQISIDGTKHRFYLLDDSRCPLPDKSYKDLAPKQIEAIYKNYKSIYDEIRDEESSYNKAVNEYPAAVADLKKLIEDKIKKSDSKFNKDFANKTLDQAYGEVIDGKISLIQKYEEEIINKIKKNRALLDRGIRTPEEILETYKNKNDLNTAPRKFSL